MTSNTIEDVAEANHDIDEDEDLDEEELDDEDPF
jgi:hypothetical protein